MNGIPLFFKLFTNRKHVGYEKHENVMGYMEIFHSRDGETWYCILDHEGTRYIPHDEKRQWVGCSDRKGEMVYMGDMFINDITGNPYAKVEFHDGVLAAFSENLIAIGAYFHACDFKFFEIYKGDSDGQIIHSNNRAQ